DERSDIYSLGVTLYELITQGVGPFTASRSNSPAVLAQVRAGQVLPLRLLAPNVPPPLERAVLRAMHFKPRRRHGSAVELAAELEASLRAGAGAGGRPGPARGRRPGRPRLLLAASAVILVAGIAALAVLVATWSGGRGTPTTDPTSDRQPPAPQ